MDLDGDGHNDILSGSYWPGDLFVFRGQADGSFRAGEKILDREGKPLNAGGPWKSKDQPDMDSLASVPFAVDADGDGDLDLLVGNIQGRVVLIPNQGTARAPAFDPSRRQPLRSAGGLIQVPGGDSGPVVADWDGDRKPDLLVGCGDGSVFLYRNTATEAGLTFASAEVLVGKAPTEPVPHGQAPGRPGRRTKVHVADWNGDGRPDLLVGDYWSEAAAPVKLTPEQERRRDDLQKRRKEATERWSALAKRARDEKRLREEDPELQAVQKEMAQIGEELGALVPYPKARGSVWLYRRKAAPKD